MPLTDEQKEALALELKDKVLKLLEGNTHQVALTALINAYLTVGITHDCCTQTAANTAMRASMVLAQKAATATHPIH